MKMETYEAGSRSDESLVDRSESGESLVDTPQAEIQNLGDSLNSPTAQAEQNNDLGEGKVDISSTEQKNSIVDEKLDELLKVAGDSPEAQKEALGIFVSQVKQIGEQMRLVRDAENLQELKKLMANHWEELEIATGGNHELLQEIQEWGRDFVESKALYYDYMNGIKMELNEKTLGVSGQWAQVQATLGSLIKQARGENNRFGSFGLETDIEHILYNSNQSLLDKDGRKRGVFEKETKLEFFIKSVTSVETGYASGDIDIASLSEFYSDFSRVIARVSSEDNVDSNSIKELLSQFSKLQRLAKETMDIYASTKKLRENHFQDIFNKSFETEQEVDPEVNTQPSDVQRQDILEKQTTP